MLCSTTRKSSQRSCQIAMIHDVFIAFSAIQILWSFIYSIAQLIFFRVWFSLKRSYHLWRKHKHNFCASGNCWDKHKQKLFSYSNDSSQLSPLEIRLSFSIERGLRTSIPRKRSKMAEKLDSENILLITDSYKVSRPSFQQNLVITWFSTFKITRCRVLR